MEPGQRVESDRRPWYGCHGNGEGRKGDFRRSVTGPDDNDLHDRGSHLHNNKLSVSTTTQLVFITLLTFDK